MGLFWPCPQIIRPDWKGLPSANPLAYWASLSVTKKKSFMTLTPGGTSPPESTTPASRTGKNYHRYYGFVKEFKVMKKAGFFKGTPAI